MANLAGDGIALQMAQSAWGADDEIMGHTKEKTVFDDARAGAEFSDVLRGDRGSHRYLSMRNCALRVKSPPGEW